MKKLIILAVVTFALVGCVSKYKPLSVEQPTVKLGSHSSIFVMLPADGQYNGKYYAGSGAATARALVSALSVRTAKVTLDDKVEELNDALTKAKQSDHQYLIQTSILNWEDRATEWSGIPDKIALKYTAFNVSTGQQIAATTSKASSKWATFGGDHPQDLLPVPTQEFVNTLF